MAELTPEQRHAVESARRAMVLLAGAGSGKTTVLVQRYRRLLALGYPPSRILAVTFTQEAAEGLRARIADGLRAEDRDGRLADQVEGTASIGTIHSFCYGLIDQYGSHLGLPPITGIADGFLFGAVFDREYRVWWESLPATDLEWLLERFPRTEIRDTARRLYGAHREPDGKLSEDALRLRALLAPLFAAVDGRLLGQGLYGFSDLELYAWRLLGEVSEVRTRVRGQYRAVLVDEFQDTSAIQWAILEAVVGDRWDRLFVVGDPKQSIYAFRDADVRIFLDVAARLESHGGELAELSLNFRSRPSLLEGLNRLAEPLFAEGKIPFRPMRSGQGESSAGEVRLLRHSGDETAAVADAVADLVESGVAPSDIALLFRVSDRIIRFRDALAERGIEGSTRQGEALFGAYDTLGLAAYFRSLADPRDDFALAAFLRSDFVGLTPEEMVALAKEPGDTLFEKLLGRRDGRLGWWLAAVESGGTIGEALERLVAASPYWPRKRDLFLALAGAMPWDAPIPHAVELLENWAREGIRVEGGWGGEGGVRLMTVHGAKGLEFPHVFLVDLLRLPARHSPTVRRQTLGGFGLRVRRNGEAVEDELYGRLASLAKETEREESRRILYVALTRAQETLTVSLPSDATRIPRDTWAHWLGSVLIPREMPEKKERSAR